MMIPKELKYTKTHEWINFKGNNIVEIGITDHAQEAMGDLVYIDLPKKGDNFKVNEIIAEAESVKAVSSIFSPVFGTVIEVNAAVYDKPEMINDSPYEAWIVKLEINTDVLSGLLNSEEYEKFLEEEKNV